MDGISVKSFDFICFYFCSLLLFIISLSIFLATSLLKRFNEATEMSAKQTDIFNQLSATFSSETINKWETLVENWNADSKAPNPYQEPKNCKLHLYDMLCLYKIGRAHV